jgi:putative transposase
MKEYPTNVTNSQWQYIENVLNYKRKRKVSLRVVWNGIMYLVRTGCQWRMLPKEFGCWNTVYYYYRKWKDTGVIEQIHELLRDLVRKAMGKKESPSAACIDSQSVKMSRQPGEKGVDGGKKVKCRKRHIVTDTLGLLLVVVVHAANKHDSQSAQGVIEMLRGRFARLKVIFADGGYRGELVDSIKNTFGWILSIVLRSDSSKGFEVLPKRWIVERTFSWFEGFRRLSKDYETKTCTSETMVQLAMIQIMLNRVKNKI